MKFAYLGPISLHSLASHNPAAKNAPKVNSFDAASAIVDSFIKYGHHVTVITFSGEISKPVRATGEKLAWDIVPWHPRPGRNLFLRNSLEVRNALLRSEVDFVFANWSYEYGLATILSGLPHVITIHDAPWIVSWYLKPRHYWLPRAFLSTIVIARAARLACVSPYIREYLAKRHHRHADVIPNPLPLYLTAPRPPDRQPSLERPVRYVSLLSDTGDRKNPKPMLLGFRDLIASGIHAELYLYGADCGKSSALHSWANENKVADRVHFVGRVPHQELMHVLRHEADVLVHPSLEESFGLSIAEAMACGLPVIGGMHSGAVPWVAGEGKAGLMIDVADPSEFTIAMKRLADSPELRKTLGMAGYKDALKRFNPERVASAYLQIAEASLANNEPPATPWD